MFMSYTGNIPDGAHRDPVKIQVRSRDVTEN